MCFPVGESLLEKILGKIHNHDSSSSSDSDNEKSSSSSSLKSKVFRLFGRETPLHNVLGGGKDGELKDELFCIRFASFESEARNYEKCEQRISKRSRAEKDVVNYEEFLRNLTNEVSPWVDTAKLPHRLESISAACV